MGCRAWPYFLRQRQRSCHIGNRSGLSCALDVGERKPKFIAQFVVVVALGQLFEDEACSVFSLPSENRGSDVPAIDLPICVMAIRRDRYGQRCQQLRLYDFPGELFDLTLLCPIENVLARP